MQKNLFRESTMSRVLTQLRELHREEMRSHISRIAGTRSLGETTEILLRKAARQLGFSYQRAHSYYYRKVKRVPGDELEIARKVAGNIEAKEQKLKALENAYEAKRLELDQAEAGAGLATAKYRVHERSD